MENNLKYSEGKSVQNNNNSSSKMESILSRLSYVIGVILMLLFVGLPKDLWRWLNLKRKSVNGKTVVITGGGSGIGKRLAELFADPKGLAAQVTIIDRNIKAAEQVSQEINKIGGISQAWECDVSDNESMNKCAESIKERFGNVDIVICNAAILYFALINELKSEELSKGLNVNVLGTINTIKAFLPDMEKKKSGQIVTICSISSFMGETFGMSYCPTKFAVRGVMECLRMELRDKGLESSIKCTTICPYFVRTPMILNEGLRPISRWLPFMSIDRCAFGMIDAILKEKVLIFIPAWLNVLVLLYNLFSINMQRIARDFLAIHYEKSSIENYQKSNGKEMMKIKEKQFKNDYFKMAGLLWWIIIPFGMGLIFLAYINPQMINLTFIGHITFNLGTEHPYILFFINIMAWIVHLIEAIIALNLCDSLNLTHKVSFQWFLQTLILGFPSLFILIKCYNKKKRE